MNKTPSRRLATLRADDFYFFKCQVLAWNTISDVRRSEDVFSFRKHLLAVFGQHAISVLSPETTDRLGFYTAVEHAKNHATSDFQCPFNIIPVQRT